MFVLEANIPEFLLSSPYLQSLLSNGPFPEEGLEIPDRNCKQDLTVTSRDDLIQLLSTLRFWLVPEVAEQSSDLLRFAFTQANFVEATAEFCNDIPFVNELSQIVNCEDTTKLEITAKYGRLCVLQFLCENVGLEPSSQAACVAAGVGHLACLTYLHLRGLKFNDSTVVEAAARGGQFECVKYMVDSCPDAAHHFKQLACHRAAEQGHLACVKQMLIEWGDTYNNSAVVGAATGNQLEVLTHATSRVMSGTTQHAMDICAKRGHLECLKHLHNYSNEINYDLMHNASARGHLSCLKFLHEHNYPGNEDVCFEAAQFGHLECLKYAHEQDMPWDEYTCSIAADEGHLACLQYAHEHGCPWWDGPAVEDLPLNDRNMHCANRIKVAVDFNEIDFNDEDEGRELIAACACRAQTIDCLLYVLEQGAALSPNCAGNASFSTSLATLEFLHARGFTWEAEDCEAAANSGSLDCLRFLHEIGTPWDARTFTATVGECYKYAVAHGCPGAELYTEFLNKAKKYT